MCARSPLGLPHTQNRMSWRPRVAEILLMSFPKTLRVCGDLKTRPKFVGSIGQLTIQSRTLYRHTVSHLSSVVKTINLPGKSQTQENWGLVAHQPPIDLQYATICSTNNTNTEHKYAPRCDHGPAELPTAAASIMDHATVSMEPQMVRPCLLPMILRTPPSSHLLRVPPSSHRRFH